MRVLLVHPADSPLSDPWAREQWDLVVDMGKSTGFSQQRWAKALRSRVVCADSFQPAFSEAEELRQIFSAGRGQLLDEEGIDYWDLISLTVVEHALATVRFYRLAAEIPKSSQLWCTRDNWPATVLPLVLNQPCNSFETGPLPKAKAGARHYASIFRTFSFAQVKEIAWDKYDPGYRWRSRFAARQTQSDDPKVLIPSAYENVSRMAAAYAALLPSVRFLLVATRRSARQFTPQGNIQVCDLVRYAKGERPLLEIRSLEERWRILRASLQSSDLWRVLLHSGVFDLFPGWLRKSLNIRNAWRSLLSRQPVSGILCGDDSNPDTRLPVLLGAKRKIPTVDFHHGAIDGRYLFKDLPSDAYLAKNAMEQDYLLRHCHFPGDKIVIGAPAAQVRDERAISSADRNSIVLFSEPYETAGMRACEVYGELLPPLWRLAVASGHRLAIKLHPFESVAQRQRIIRSILPEEVANHIPVFEGPLTDELMASCWCGITIESTVVLECQKIDVCCFLCGWMSMSPYGYHQQYARFGIGETLKDLAEISQIPRRVEEFRSRPKTWRPGAVIEPALMKELLTSPAGATTVARSRYV